MLKKSLLASTQVASLIFKVDVVQWHTVLGRSGCFELALNDLFSVRGNNILFPGQAYCKFGIINLFG